MGDEYLEHHGVRGMKWGVRRYQNYDGSLTAAGMKRFNKSLGEYEKADARYKQAKSEKKAAVLRDDYQGVAQKKGELTNAKLDRKIKKARLEKDYKHLKQDKLADQGKKLYASGKTITGNNELTSLLNTIGTMGLGAASFNAKSGGMITQVLRQATGIKLDDKQFVAVTGGIGVAALGASAAKRGVDEYQNKRLRAYYSHTSNY